MKKQTVFEIIVYITVGIFFFIGYYFLAKEVIKFDPFSGYGLIPSIYFVIAILFFPSAGEIVSSKIQIIGIGSKILMPLAYIFAPFISILFRKE